MTSSENAITVIHGRTEFLSPVFASPIVFESVPD
jgi:hypothetical protein